MKNLEILETCLYVDDLAAAEQFYAGVLELPVVDRQDGRHVFFRCGRSMLLVFDPEGSKAGSDVPAHGARGPGHVAFSVTAEELADWQQQLTSFDVAIEQTVDWPNGGKSLYFRDPSGNSLEFTSPTIWGLPTDR